MSGLAPKELRLARLSVGIATGNWEALRQMRRGAPAGEPDRAWREVVLQSHLFCGFPRVVEACEVLRGEGGLGLETAEEALPQGDRFEAGRALFERIYGEKAEAVRAVLKGYHTTLERWIEGHAYGRVLSRPGLSAAHRELCAVATLAALGQERQLASHARGALHCGASAEQVRACVEGIEDLIAAEDLRHALRVLERFT